MPEKIAEMMESMSCGKLRSLIRQYANIIKLMEESRGTSPFYKQCDMERERLHNEILCALEIERGSKMDIALQCVVGELIEN